MKRKITSLFLTLFLTLFCAMAQTMEEHQKKGEALMTEGKNAEALDEFKKAIEFDQSTDGNSLLYSYAGICAKNIKSPEAKGFLQSAIDRGFEEPIIFNMLGEICKEDGDVECQVNTWQKAMEMFPAQQQEYGKRLAYVYYNDNAFEKLELLTSELLREDPKDVKMLQFYATSLQKNKKINEAKAAFEELLVLDPENLNGNVFMGNYYYQIGRSQLDKEEKKYEAIQNPDRVMWSNYQKKVKLIREDYYVKAIAYLEKAYEQNQNPNVRKMLHAAHFRLGNKEEAEKYNDN